MEKELEDSEIVELRDGKIVGLCQNNNGRSCESHAVCGEYLQEGDLIRLKKCVVEIEGAFSVVWPVEYIIFTPSIRSCPLTYSCQSVITLATYLLFWAVWVTRRWVIFALFNHLPIC